MLVANKLFIVTYKFKLENIFAV